MSDERQSARPIEELDNASQARLKNILGQDPKSINASDAAFLQGRSAYLTAGERKDFGVKAVKGDDNAGGDKYDSMKQADLRKEAKKRELPTGGTNDELRARLREADAQV